MLYEETFSPQPPKHSVIKERGVGSRYASFSVPDTLRRFILSSKEGGFLAAKSVNQVKKAASKHFSGQHFSTSARTNG
jgi:hypothetical protein